MDKFTKADQVGQEKLVNQLNKIFSNCTLTIDQHYIDKETVDVYTTATTVSNVSYLYVFEAKDRTYKHNAKFITDEGVILEIPKYKELMARKDEYKPMYVHTFSDDWISIWDVSKLDMTKIKCVLKYLPKTTVEDRGKEWRYVYLIPRSECVYDNSFIV